MKYEEALRLANEAEQTAIDEIDARMETLIATLPENGQPEKAECIEKWKEYLDAADILGKKNAMGYFANIFDLVLDYIYLENSFLKDFEYEYFFGLEADDTNGISYMTKVYEQIKELANNLVYARSKIYSFADSKTIYIDGAAVITDPCYIAKEDDRFNFGYYGDLQSIGIPTSTMRETLYGDWSCTVFDSVSKEPLGRFCADDGKVCVADKEEVIAYNPDFFEQYGDWCYTVIEDFKGEVVIKVFGTGNDAYVSVIGTGTRKSSGEIFAFESRQTGL